MKKFVLILSAAVALGVYSPTLRAAESAAGDDSPCCAEKVSACTVESGMAKGGADKADKNGRMVGDHVENFTLTDGAGKSHSLSDYKDKVAVLIFYNQSCPFVKEAKGRIADFAKNYEAQGVQVLGIDSGTNNSTDSIGEHMKDISFPVLVNGSQDLAVTFGATHTPEVYVLDKKQNIAYHGAFDNGQAAANDGRKTYTEDAVKAVLRGEAPALAETKALGCTIVIKKKGDDAAKIEAKGQKQSEMKAAVEAEKPEVPMVENTDAK
ncbi:hypothetical protein BH09SUM1_BH09SUM1_09850 [soil metagenome]